VQECQLLVLLVQANLGACHRENRRLGDGSMNQRGYWAWNHRSCSSWQGDLEFGRSASSCSGVTSSCVLLVRKGLQTIRHVEIIS
jgi:hypothetical protein